MHKVLPAQRNWPLHATASSRAIERAALAKLAPHTLMERAGLSAARLGLALGAGKGLTCILCGPGNNGGDGLVMARLLHSQGLPVQVSLIGYETNRPLPPDAQAAMDAARQAGVAISEGLREAPQPSLLVDALLGLGLSRAPAPPFAAAIRHLNASAAPVLALDLPSGLLADTGHLAGGEAVHAQHTLSLLTLKPGLFTGQGRAHCGQIWFDPLGQEPQEQGCDAQLLGANALLPLMRSRWNEHDQHKGSRGDVLVVGGATGMRGAAQLAGRAALAAGAGRVYLCLLSRQAQDASPEADALRPELMQFELPRMLEPQAWRSKVLVCGCGGGSAVAEWLPIILREALHLVLDADALNTIAQRADLQAALSQRAAQALATVLTPHPLEAARLLGCSTADVQADRLKAARRLSARFNCPVLLKGSGSVIADEQLNSLSINSSGNAALATAGSGDVLAGWLGGLWAQHPDLAPAQVAGAACYWHGRAADAHTAGPLRAADLVERMHQHHPLLTLR